MIDWRSLIKDKRFQVGAVVAGGAGAYVLFKGKGSGSSSTDTSTAADVAGSSGSTGTPTFSDGGSDIAATLGNFSTELQGILQNYADQQGSTTTPPATTTPITTPPKTIKPPVVVTAPPGTIKKAPPVIKLPKLFKTIKIKKGDTLSGIAKRDHTTVAALQKLNGIKNVNLIYAGHNLKVPVVTKK
jgi:LysM repeat protein